MVYFKHSVLSFLLFPKQYDTLLLEKVSTSEAVTVQFAT